MYKFMCSECKEISESQMNSFCVCDRCAKQLFFKDQVYDIKDTFYKKDERYQIVVKLKETSYKGKIIKRFDVDPLNARVEAEKIIKDGFYVNDPKDPKAFEIILPHHIDSIECRMVLQ